LLDCKDKENINKEKTFKGKTTKIGVKPNQFPHGYFKFKETLLEKTTKIGVSSW